MRRRRRTPLRRDRQQPSRAVPLAVGGAAAAMPALSLGQYLTQYYPQVSNKMKNAPVMSVSQLAAKSRIGDVGLGGQPFGKLDRTGYLTRGSTYMGGSPAYHGFYVGPEKRVFHGGINLQSAMSQGFGGVPPDHEFNIMNKAGIQVAGQHSAITDAWRASDGDMRKFYSLAKENLAEMRRTTEWSKGLGNPKSLKDAQKYLDDVKFSIRGYTDWDDGVVAMLRPKNLSKTQLKGMSGQLAKDWHQPYGAWDATVAGLKNVFFPRTKDKLAKKLQNVCELLPDNNQHCGSLPTKILQSIGYVKQRVGGAKWELPGNLLTNPNLDVLGIAGKNARKVMLDRLRNAAKGRTAVGIGAAGLAGGLGYGISRLLQKIRGSKGD
jgi:hypothetical protein